MRYDVALYLSTERSPLMSKLKVGVLGCGVISKIYLKNLTGPFADRVEVVAVADVMPEAAKARAEEYKIARHCTPAELLADPAIELVASLTPAPTHYEVSKQILSAGKHLYSEKPLALSMAEGRELVELAARKKLRLSVAPDTLLGAGVQTCRKLLAEGLIGTPVAAHGFIALGGNSERYMSVFRGPLLDLGPYHVGAVLTYFGPAKSVVGIAHPKRQTPDNALSPAAMTVDNPGHAAAVIEFHSGVLVTLIATAEHNAYNPALRVWGTTHTLVCNDPNMFTGKIELAAPYKPLEEVPPPTPAMGYPDNGRGIGIWDLAGALTENRPHRLGPDLALHTLEVMLAVIDSQKTGRRIDLTTSFTPAEPLPTSDTPPIPPAPEPKPS